MIDAESGEELKKAGPQPALLLMEEVRRAAEVMLNTVHDLMHRLLGAQPLPAPLEASAQESGTDGGLLAITLRDYEATLACLVEARNCVDRMELILCGPPLRDLSKGVVRLLP